MTDSNVSNKKNENFQKFVRFTSLSNGEFWLAKKDMPKSSISKDQLLMISQIDDISD
jgi:predicted type IV restriction endonuclease